MATTGIGFAISVGYYSLAFLALIITFGVLRNRKKFRRFYAPKNYLPDDLVDGFARPPPMPRSYLLWVLPVLSYDQRQVLAFSGMDGLTMMRVLYFGLAWSMFASFLCLSTCLPVNLMGAEVDALMASNPNVTLNVIDKFTMANVSPQDPTIVVHVVVVYLLSLFTFALLWHWHKEAVGLRINYLASRPRGSQTNTVLVSDIPGMLEGTTLDRAMFLLPEGKRRAAAKKLTSTAGGIRQGGAGTLGRIGNTLFNFSMHTLAKCHMWRRPLPITSYSPSGKPTYFEPLHSPYEEGQQDMGADTKAFSSRNGSSGSGDGGGGGQKPRTENSEAKTSEPHVPVSRMASIPLQEERSTRPITLGTLNPKAYNTVAGIPLQEELSAWPKANRMLAAGMSVDEMVDAEFREVFGSEYRGSQLVYNTSALEAPYNEYKRRAEGLMDSFDAWAMQAQKGKLRGKRGKALQQPKMRIVPPKLGKWGLEAYGARPVKVPVVDFQVARLDELARVIKQKQQEARGRPIPAAFAMFSSRAKQTLVATSLVHHDTSCWRAREAPAPHEVIWANLRWRGWEITVRSALIWVGYGALVLLFMVPVTALQGLIASVTWLDWLRNIGPLESLYTSVVPVLILKLFMILVPFILRIMWRAKGETSAVDVDLGVETGFYVFQVVVVFFTSLIGGALLSALEDFIDDPGSIVDLLGATVPTQALFFTSYIMLEALVTMPFQLANIVGLVIYKAKLMMYGSDRAKARVWQEQRVSYGSNVGEIMLSFLLIMVFSPVFPIMAPFGVLWFCVAIIAWKYKLCYVWRPGCESGGRLWPRAYWQILLNLFWMQLLVCFVVSVKKNVVAAVSLVPLMLATPIFGVAANRRFRRPLAIMSLRAAANQDARDEQRAAQSGGGAASAQGDAETGGGGDSSTGGAGANAGDLAAYLSPLMVFDDARHQAIKAEAARWQAVFASGSYNPQDFALDGEDEEGRANSNSDTSPSQSCNPSTAGDTVHLV